MRKDVGQTVPQERVRKQQLWPSEGLGSRQGPVPWAASSKWLEYPLSPSPAQPLWPYPPDSESL